MQEDPTDVVARMRGEIARRDSRSRAWNDLYHGSAPLLFTSPEFRVQSGGLFDDFADNWCKIVPDVAVERMVPLDFLDESGEPDPEASRAWRRSRCQVEFPLAALDSQVRARAYGMVWRPDGEAGPAEIMFLTTAQACVEYEPGRRRMRRYGLHVYCDDVNEYATLFVRATAEVFRYQRRRSAQHSGGSGQWEPRRDGLALNDRAPHFRNPMGPVVPIVELPNRGRLDSRPRSVLEDVAPLQNVVNTLWAQLLTGADAMALPANVVMGTMRPQRDILDEDGEVVGSEDLPLDKFRRDRILWLESESASVAQLAASDLSNFRETITLAVHHIAAQTRTPAHYLLGQMVNIGAEALEADESGLVARISELTRVMDDGLMELMRLEAIASGDQGRASALELGSVRWRDPQFRSEAQYADALTKYKAIGIPDEALWARMGTDALTIDRWKAMRDDQAAAIVGGSIDSLYGVKEPTEEE